jgi:hypothetical protein
MTASEVVRTLGLEDEDEARLIWLSRNLAASETAVIQLALRELARREGLDQSPKDCRDSAGAEDLQRQIRAARGSLVGTGLSVQSFMDEKHADTEREEARLGLPTPEPPG